MSSNSVERSSSSGVSTKSRRYVQRNIPEQLHEGEGGSLGEPGRTRDPGGTEQDKR